MMLCGTAVILREPPLATLCCTDCWRRPKDLRAALHHNRDGGAIPTLRSFATRRPVSHARSTEQRFAQGDILNLEGE
jgi:hypothetical protein